MGMKNQLKAKIAGIVDDKLSDAEIEELISFFKCALADGFNLEDEHFFKDLAYEMSSSVKDLALMLIEFRKDLLARIHPGITDLTEKYIPQAADQLEGIIETTEQAANKIMDNLEAMQGDTETVAGIMSSFNSGVIPPDDVTAEAAGAQIDSQTLVQMMPHLNQMTEIADNNRSLIADTFVQMSFQDLTGQRIKRIMKLVREMESRLQKMIVSFGIRLAEKERNPEITESELAQAVADKETELAGPQKVGCGLDQAGIDELLANI